MNTEETLVSIIVPVHNSQEYLTRCVDSILGQEYQNIELILADDGSTDASASLCDSYRARDPRVRVLHKPATGVSDTRNRALDMARGTYIQFVDSDDWISPEATRLLVRSMERNHCDMVISDFYRVSGEHFVHKGDISDTHVLTREEFSSFMIENPADFYYGVLWNKLFKKEIIDRCQIRMDVEISWCEDFLFNLEYIRHAHSFLALQAPIYYYVKRKGSLVSQSFSVGQAIRMKLNIFEYYQEFYKDIYDQEDYKNIRPQVYRFFLSVAKDGAVPPLPLPGVQKLGKEKPHLPDQAITDRGLPMDLYRYRKLMAYQLNTVAKKNHLTLEECQLLYHLFFVRDYQNIHELADFTGFTPRKVSSLVQSLTRRNLLVCVSRKHAFSFSFPSSAQQVLLDLEMVSQDFDSIRFQGFSEEQRQSHQQLESAAQENISDFLTRL